MTFTEGERLKHLLYDVCEYFIGFWFLRNLTELRISEGQNPFVLTIKTEQDHAEELLDQLLEWFFLEEELHDESGGDAEAEQQEEIDLEHGSESDASTPETSHHTRGTVGLDFSPSVKPNDNNVSQTCSAMMMICPIIKEC